ncbi:unnamed protein product, partial [Musa banksii]
MCRRRTRGGRRFAVTLDADGWDSLERDDPTAESTRLRRFVASIKGSTAAAKTRRERRGEEKK